MTNRIVYGTILANLNTMNTPKTRHLNGRRRKGALDISELVSQLPKSMLGYKDEVVGRFRFIQATGVAHVHLNG